MGQPPILVRRLGPAQRDGAIATLAAAMEDDPWKRWALASERYHETLAEGTAYDVDEALANDELWGAGEVEAVACWAPPGTREERRADIAAWFEANEAEHFARPVEEVAELERRLTKALPDGPFWYLELLGARPSAQGRGLGTALLRAALARCERDGIPAAVDTANPRAVQFYERLGFRLLDSVSHAGSPEMWVLCREP